VIVDDVILEYTAHMDHSTLPGLKLFLQNYSGLFRSSKALGGKSVDVQSTHSCVDRTLDSVFEGPNGDYSAVLEITAGILVAQALWKPLPTRNSTCQIANIEKYCCVAGINSFFRAALKVHHDGQMDYLKAHQAGTQGER
jgi:hypothetical protein